jgi:gliding motility-associated protein GldC
MADNHETESEIILSVTLDQDRIPVKMTWDATSAGMESKKACKSMILSFWDESGNSSYRLDLWTKDMSINEMHRFTFETMMAVTETYERATSDKQGMDSIKKSLLQFRDTPPPEPTE